MGKQRLKGWVDVISVQSPLLLNCSGRGQWRLSCPGLFNGKLLPCVLWELCRLSQRVLSRRNQEDSVIKKGRVKAVTLQILGLRCKRCLYVTLQRKKSDVSTPEIILVQKRSRGTFFKVTQFVGWATIPICNEIPASQETSKQTATVGYSTTRKCFWDSHVCLIPKDNLFNHVGTKCHHEWVTLPLWTSFLPSIKWKQCYLTQKLL